ncbi:hypothetical protein EMN47_19305 [Prolixibacteraceae bacterium JC049]|nr:hypothetical protein [Prolixibacteraceae bacterium JC049]
MDNLEKIINENKAAFNQAEPSEAHFDKFEAMLNELHSEEEEKKEEKKTRWTSGSWLKVAAVLAIALFVTDQVYDRFMQPAPAVQFTLSDVSEQYQEAEQFYMTSISNEQTNLQRLMDQKNLSAEEKKMIDTELKELNQRFDQLQKDLAANPNDDRVINAMIQFYQTKSNMLQLIINQLKNVKQQNNQNYEDNRI